MSEPPPDDRYLDDFVPGSVYEYGPVTFSEAEILEFARKYDPQPIHTDPDWARTGPFGGLIASGWHTTAVTMRLLVENYLPAAASLASPGIDELRWLRPVRPGDSLRVRLTVLEVRPSRTKPDRGLVRSRAEIFDAQGSVVMTLVALNMMLRRPTPPAPAGAP
jgi:acyl dehydratase